jgi:hypothetical protein
MSLSKHGAFFDRLNSSSLPPFPVRSSASFQPAPARQMIHGTQQKCWNTISIFEWTLIAALALVSSSMRVVGAITSDCGDAMGPF